MTELSILLQAAPAKGGGMSQIIMLVAIFAIFWLFMIRPQMKRQKDIKKFREAIKVGDKVVTGGGIYGKVKDIKDDVITLEIADNVRIRVDKASVFQSIADTQGK